MDLSPNYAGTLMGITNTFANMGGFAAPYFTGYITNGNVSFMLNKALCLIRFYWLISANFESLEDGVFGQRRSFYL